MAMGLQAPVRCAPRATCSHEAVHVACVYDHASLIDMLEGPQETMADWKRLPAS